MTDEKRPPIPPRDPAEARARQAAKRTPEQAERYAEVMSRAIRMQDQGVAAPKGKAYGDGGKK